MLIARGSSPRAPAHQGFVAQLEKARDAVQATPFPPVAPQQPVFAENRTRTMNPDSAIVISRVVVPGSVAERAVVHRTTVGLPVPQNGSGHDQSHILAAILISNTWEQKRTASRLISTISLTHL